MTEAPVNIKRNTQSVPEWRSSKPLENAGLQILHGFGSYNNGLNRWYDATIQLIVTRTGFNGLCIEHSVAEGLKGRRKLTKLDEQSPPPKPLSWLISDKARDILSNQMANFDNLAKELQLKVLVFEEFGKNLIKISLAHYRLHGYLVSPTKVPLCASFGRQSRQYKSSHAETLLWVKSMLDPAVRRERRKELFAEAARKQAFITQELRRLLSCYGPVVEDGYGCAYNIQPDKIIFAPSAYKSNMRTDIADL
uniref:Choline O-acetyltransferase n=1 Tax=Ditylenchus dipsaci TaxID=166011 RepID=A0A915EH52_9BILA